MQASSRRTPNQRASIQAQRPFPATRQIGHGSGALQDPRRPVERQGPESSRHLPHESAPNAYSSLPNTSQDVYMAQLFATRGNQFEQNAQSLYQPGSAMFQPGGSAAQSMPLGHTKQELY